jgi:ATP-dependent RNA helicase RhlE
MLDMGFIQDVKKIIGRLPAKRQSLCFSATMPPEIKKLAATILVNPVKVDIIPVVATSNLIKQSLYYVDKPDKKSLLIHLLKDNVIETALVFTRTKHGADKVTRDLMKAGINAAAIHGNKSQVARQSALNNFKRKRTRVLVATDIASRGIDVEQLSHVINYEIPNIPETYIHRIGRTGRAGVDGVALSFCDAEEKEFLRDINKLLTKPIPVIEDHPFPMKNSVHSGPVLQSRPFNGNRNRPARSEFVTSSRVRAGR